MKIGIPYSNGEVWQHFGKAPQFIIYTVISGEITGSEIVDSVGHGHSSAVALLKSKGVDTVICGGLGQGAYDGLQSAGIFLIYPGVKGLPEDAVKAMISGNLKFDMSAVHVGGHCHGGH